MPSEGLIARGRCPFCHVYVHFIPSLTSMPYDKLILATSVENGVVVEDHFEYREHRCTAADPPRVLPPYWGKVK